MQDPDRPLTPTTALRVKEREVSLLREIVTKHSDWTIKVLLLIGLGLNLWLNKNFVTRPEYFEDQKANAAAHLIIQTSVNDIAATLKIMAVQQARVEDHEFRLRRAEEKLTDAIARLVACERIIETKLNKP